VKRIFSGVLLAVTARVSYLIQIPSLVVDRAVKTEAMLLIPLVSFLPSLCTSQASWEGGGRRDTSLGERLDPLSELLM